MGFYDRVEAMRDASGLRFNKVYDQTAGTAQGGNLYRTPRNAVLTVRGSF